MAGEFEGSGSFHPMKCDVSKQEEIVGMFETIKEKHGGVDLCVNNAGLAHDAPLLSGCYDQWRDMLDVCKQVLIIYLVKPYYFCILNRVASLLYRPAHDHGIFSCEYSVI